MIRRQQRGVALLAAILVVALATVLVAAMLDRSEAAQARSRNAWRAEQGWQLMHGLEGWAAAALRRDLEQDGVDGHDDVWAQELPPIELPGGRILGRVRELSGCFNLNNLVIQDAVSEDWVGRFRRLLAALKLDEAIADQAVDWIDTDAQPQPRGAEDMRTLLQRPAYRTANRPFAHVSELRLLPGVTDAIYTVLAPQVCALPPVAGSVETGTPVNLNTATRELWQSLSDQITPNIAQQMWRDGHARFSSIDAVNQELERLTGAATLVPTTNAFSVASQWFVLEAEIQSDGIPFLYSSLLQRTPNGTYVHARWRGGYTRWGARGDGDAGLVDRAR